MAHGPAPEKSHIKQKSINWKLLYTSIVATAKT
jgi:hypothetical protein